MRRVIGGALIASCVVALGSSAFGDANDGAAGIPWMDNLVAAYKKSIEEQKPLVAYFHFKGCRWCAKLELDVMEKPEFAAMADKAVWVKVDSEQDDDKKNVSRMIEQLKIQSYPILSVLDCKPDKIEELVQVTGYFEPRVVNEEIQKGIKQYEAANPKATPRKPYGESNMTGTLLAPAPNTDVYATLACSVSDAALVSALQKLGYPPATSRSTGSHACMHRVTVPRDGKRYELSLHHTTGQPILARVKLKSGAAPAAEKLLDAQETIFPSYFIYDKADRALFLACAVDERDALTPERLESQLKMLIDTAAKTEPIWK